MIIQSDSAQRKIVFIVSAVVLLIIIVGSHYASADIRKIITNPATTTPTVELNSNPLTQTSPQTSADLHTQADKLATVRLKPVASKSPSKPSVGTITYDLSITLPTAEPVSSFALKIYIAGATGISTDFSTKKSSTGQSSSDWQSFTNSTLTDESGTTVLELGMINRSEEIQKTAEISLGSITITTAATAPSITVDSLESMVLTADTKYSFAKDIEN